MDSGGFTVKEMVVRLDGKLDGILVSLNSKADRDEVRDLEKRVSSLEGSRTANVALSTWQRWFFGAVCIGLVGCVIALIALVLGGHT